MSTERANSTDLRTVTLPGGEEIPVLGVGTWGLAERPVTAWTKSLRCRWRQTSA